MHKRNPRHVPESDALVPENATPIRSPRAALKSFARDPDQVPYPARFSHRERLNACRNEKASHPIGPRSRSAYS